MSVERVEAAARAVHAVEYGTGNPDAVEDHNRWTWDGQSVTDGERATFTRYAAAALTAADGYDRAHGVARCTVDELRDALADYVRDPYRVAAAVHAHLTGETETP